jgi:hypothetical protein
MGTFLRVPEQLNGTERAVTLSIFLPQISRRSGSARQDASHVIVAFAPLVVVVAASGTAPLAAAHARGDHDEVARLADQAGAAIVATLLLDDDRTAFQVGLAAATHVPDPWDLLLPLGRLAAGWDRSRAAPAAYAAARISRGLDEDLAILHDLPDDQLETLQQGWAAIAARADRWADVRVHALEVAAALAEARRVTAEDPPGLGYDLALVLTDEDAEVRRAGCELVPQPAPADSLATLGAAVRGDVDGAVALACAQALCAGLAWDPATPVLTALGDEGAARLRAIAKGPLPAVPAGALVDAVRCLAARRTRADNAAIGQLAAKAPKQVRAMIQRAQRRGAK